LVFLPARVLDEAGIQAPTALGPAQYLGATMLTVGALLAVSCILTFVWIGKGTPAPFDPPQRLVVRGPYRLMRNPMYVGAGLALLGGAVYFGSAGVAVYAAGFLLVADFLVRWYEEPTLRRTFGAEYAAYCATTPRWFPRRTRRPRSMGRQGSH
jgi:protein-S-isoprenylcysteine O-methyltransferase Ste14